jgi:hypothetical protein
MYRESLTWLVALVLPLAGTAAFWPAIGPTPPASALALQPEENLVPVAQPGPPAPLPAPPAMPPPAAAGLWLNF